MYGSQWCSPIEKKGPTHWVHKIYYDMYKSYCLPCVLLMWHNTRISTLNIIGVYNFHVWRVIRPDRYYQKQSWRKLPNYHLRPIEELWSKTSLSLTELLSISFRIGHDERRSLSRPDLHSKLWQSMHGNKDKPFTSISKLKISEVTMVMGSFPFLPPSPTDKIIISPLADMLRWAVWFKFMLTKVIANTCLFILTSFSKQSASWNVLEICELCALSTDSRKTYSVNKYMYTGSSSYKFDWGEIIRWGGGGGRNGKDPGNV